MLRTSILEAKLVPAGEYAHRHRLIIKVKENFDFNDADEKDSIFAHWLSEKNVPPQYEEAHGLFEKLFSIIHLQPIEFLIGCREEEVFFELIAEKSSVSSKQIDELQELIPELIVKKNSRKSFLEE